MGIEAATLLLGAQAVGAGASAYGAYTKAKGEKAAYNYQAQIAENNRQMATWQAEDAITRGQTAAARLQLKTAQLKGTQRASLAARGLDLGEGSPLNILTDTDFMGAIDANTLTDNAAKEAWAFRQQASNYGSNAELLRMRADNVSPLMDAGTTLLTGAGKVASTWYYMNNKTAGSTAKVGNTNWTDN
jgi:hypothetical protein